MKTKYHVICYTRLPKEDDVYSEKLAYSMHLALQKDEGEIVPLNHNSGILYAKALQRADGTLHAKSLKNPRLFTGEDGSFQVVAVRTEADGSREEGGKETLLYFISGDLIHYREAKLPDGMEEMYRAAERDALHNAEPIAAGKLPEGALVRNRIAVSEETARGLSDRFLMPENTANEVPKRISASSAEELQRVKALARYSDGSSVEKRVDWFTDEVDFDRPGIYSVTGLVHQDHYEFPIALHRADPCIGRWKGKYYFIATNDLNDNHSLSIRQADTIPGLVTAQEVKILDTDMYPHLGGLLWAPEFHIIRDRLYIFHAGTPEKFEHEQCHVMALKENGNPMKASDWEMPVRVVKKDGSPLYGEQGITLDMTEFEADGRCYAVWSQRQFVPVDQGAWLYLAEVNPQEPWKLISDPLVLSMPEYGWANNHTFVEEGPYALIGEDKIFLTFSGAAVDSTYVVGLFTADRNADLLNPESWRKENCPILSSRSVEGEYGTGHNSYITDEDGLVWNVYHGRPGIDAPRCTGLRRVHFGRGGYPVLAMTEEKDLKPELAMVSMEVEVG